MITSIIRNKDLSILIITFFLVLTVSITNSDFEFFPYGEDGKIIEQMRKQNGLVISSLGVQGFKNFNILSYTGRPHYIAGQQLIKINYQEEIFIDVYCNAIFANTYSQKFAKQKECFAQRTPELWKFIGDKLGVNSIIVNKEISTRLPLVSKSRNFKLYNIK